LQHIADRPSWDCLACEKPWPCDPAREQLAGEMDSMQLAMYAWVNLEEAAEDMPAMSPDEMFERFLAWTW
jgi:hypothetical protein